MANNMNVPPKLLTWHEELDILTRFHHGDVAFSKLGLEEEENDKSKLENVNESEAGGEEFEEAHNVNKQTNRVKSIGRGSKMSTNQDDSLIARQIEKALGTGQRAESVFNSSKTSTKSEKSLDTNSPQKMSTPVKKETEKDGQRVNIRPKLVKKNSSSSSESKVSEIKHGGKGVAESREVKNSGRGRGRKVDLIAVEIPVGAVATMIKQNVGQGHRLDNGQSGCTPSLAKKGDGQQQTSHQARNKNNNNYFPSFDYAEYNKAKQYNCGQEEIAKKRELEKVVVERAVMSNWTPMDDSV